MDFMREITLGGRLRLLAEDTFLFVELHWVASGDAYALFAIFLSLFGDLGAPLSRLSDRCDNIPLHEIIQFLLQFGL